MAEIKAAMARGEDRTDWDRVDRMTEEELERNIASDPGSDIGPVDWSQAVFHDSTRKRDIHIRLDAEIVDWFKRKGRGYQTRINSVLRAYVRANRVAKRPPAKRARAGHSRVR